MIGVMENSDDIYKRYKRVILVGAITDRMVRNMREIERQKKMILSAGQSAEDQFAARQGEGAAPGKTEGDGGMNTVSPSSVAKLAGGGKK